MDKQEQRNTGGVEWWLQRGKHRYRRLLFTGVSFIEILGLLVALELTSCSNPQNQSVVEPIEPNGAIVSAGTGVEGTVVSEGTGVEVEPELCPPKPESEIAEALPQYPRADRAICLREAYESYVKGIDIDSETGRSVVVMHDGARIPWDDGVFDKTFDELLNSADLEDTLSIPYSIGPPTDNPEVNEDPGRIRADAFFRSVYGQTSDEVEDNLVQVVWMSNVSDRTLRFNQQNGAAEALRHVSDELEELPEELFDYVSTTAGTFNWRNIHGTERLSAHSFGIAIDINTEYSDYWRWRRSLEDPIEYRNEIPFEIVEVFERHGFIWGGKWYHYDTMHFEYRPELFHPNCLAEDADSQEGRELGEAEASTSQDTSEVEDDAAEEPLNTTDLGDADDRHEQTEGSHHSVDQNGGEYGGLAAENVHESNQEIERGSVENPEVIAEAQPLLRYRARIGPQDHLNSRGDELHSAGGILRQDRANVHRFGVRDSEDEVDSMFHDQERRSWLESALEDSISLPVATQILVGNPVVEITVWEHGADVTIVQESDVLVAPRGFVLVQAGVYLMGSPESEPGRSGTEREHEVTITRDFYLQVHEVTQQEWRSLMGNNPPSLVSDLRDDWPVEQVNWYEAIAYANALSQSEGLEQCYATSASSGTLGGGCNDSHGCCDDFRFSEVSFIGLDCHGYRLPTEAEWEYAARAGTTTAWYCGSNERCIDRIAWAGLNYEFGSEPGPHLVGELQANDWGLHDMSGNLSEWVWDWHGEYPNRSVADPLGPDEGRFRVVRGGDWGADWMETRSASRIGIQPDCRDQFHGFRLARTTMP